jgi:hypothetical protein
MPKLRCFILNTIIAGDFEFAYLKWILNNLNHIRKLKLRLKIEHNNRMENTLWNCIIDANFIRQYCMPDTMNNLIHFDFYICSTYKLPINENDIEKTIHSFKIHPFFIEHQWTNVKYFFDPVLSYQHLCSFLVHKPQFFDGLV